MSDSPNNENDKTRPVGAGDTRPYAPIDDDTAPPAARQVQIEKARRVSSDTTALNPSQPRTPSPQQQQNRPQPPRPRRRSQAQPRTGYRPRPAQQPGQNNPQDSALYLPWWSLVLMLVGVLVIAFGLVGGVYLLGTQGNTTARNAPQPTAIIRIITAPPDTNSGIPAAPAANLPATEIIAGGNAPGSLALSGPTLEAVQFTPTPAAIRIDSLIRVDGVDLQKLNVRDVPTISGSSVVFRADEGERFRVINGPRQADGFTWWQIQDTNSLTRSGWAVANYLSVTQP